MYNQLDVGSRAVSAQLHRNEMWDLEVLVRDSGISVVLWDIQAKSGIVGNYDVVVKIH